MSISVHRVLYKVVRHDPCMPRTMFPVDHDVTGNGTTPPAFPVPCFFFLDHVTVVSSSSSISSLALLLLTHSKIAAVVRLSSAIVFVVHNR